MRPSGHNEGASAGFDVLAKATSGRAVYAWFVAEADSKKQLYNTVPASNGLVAQLV
jgi:hypothetical protein